MLGLGPGAGLPPRHSNLARHSGDRGDWESCHHLSAGAAVGQSKGGRGAAPASSQAPPGNSHATVGLGLLVLDSSEVHPAQPPVPDPGFLESSK